jgi:hypothetical protein
MVSRVLIDALAKVGIIISPTYLFVDLVSEGLENRHLQRLAEGKSVLASNS